MQQHLMQMQPMMASYYPNNVTTDHIQQYLDENKSLILKIVEGQNTGKLNDCAENQAKLQRNLMYLAAIADSQPQPPPMHSQYPSSGMMQPGASHYMQQQQQQASQAMTPQSLMAARSSMMYSQQQQQQPFSSLQQQALHSQLVMSAGGSSGLHMLQNEASNAGGSAQLGAGYDYGRSSPVESMHRRMGKQDMGSGSSGGHGSDGSESLYLKSSDDGN